MPGPYLMSVVVETASTQGFRKLTPHVSETDEQLVGSDGADNAVEGRGDTSGTEPVLL